METDVAARAKFTGLTGATQDCSIDVQDATRGTVDVESAIVSWLAIQDHVDVELGTVAAWITGIGAILSAGAGVAMIWREVKSRQHKEIKRLDEELSVDPGAGGGPAPGNVSVEGDPGRPRHRRR